MNSVLIQSDATNFLKKCSDKQFDIAIVDPPYFSGPERKRFYGSEIGFRGVKRREYLQTEWEVPNSNYFHELKRVSIHQIIFGVNYFTDAMSAAGLNGSGRIIWDKVNGSSSFSDCEIAYCSLHDSVRLFRYMWNGMMQGKNANEGHIMRGDKSKNEERIHQCQKPVDLYKWLLNKYAKPGWKVLDTHLGSGSHRIAAFDLGFDFTGVEINGMVLKRHLKWWNIHTSQLTIPYENT